jgi:hypothetical protein
VTDRALVRQGRGNYRPAFEPDPWERQYREPASAFEGFKVYLQMGPVDRSIRRAAEEGPFGTRQVAGWARAYHWIDRAAAYDQMIERRRVAAAVHEVEVMAQRHVNTALMLQQKALERLREMEPRELNPKDVDRFIERGVAIERRARGQPDEPKIQINVSQTQQQAQAAATQGVRQQSLPEMAFSRYLNEDPSRLMAAMPLIEELLASNPSPLSEDDVIEAEATEIG